MPPPARARASGLHLKKDYTDLQKLSTEQIKSHEYSSAFDSAWSVWDALDKKENSAQESFLVGLDDVVVSNNGLLSHRDAAVLRVWAAHTLAKCASELKQTSVLISRGLDLVNVLMSSKKNCDLTMLTSTAKASRNLFWNQQEQKIKFRIMALRIARGFELFQADEFDRKLPKALGLMVREARRMEKANVKCWDVEMDKKQVQDEIEFAFGKCPAGTELQEAKFDFGLWLYDDDKTKGALMLGQAAVTSKECLHAAKCLFQEKRTIEAIQACVKGVQAWKSNSACSWADVEGVACVELFAKLVPEDSPTLPSLTPDLPEQNELIFGRGAKRELDAFCKFKKANVYAHLCENLLKTNSSFSPNVQMGIEFRRAYALRFCGETQRAQQVFSELLKNNNEFDETTTLERARATAWLAWSSNDLGLNFSSLHVNIESQCINVWEQVFGLFKQNDAMEEHVSCALEFSAWLVTMGLIDLAVRLTDVCKEWIASFLPAWSCQVQDWSTTLTNRVDRIGTDAAVAVETYGRDAEFAVKSLTGKLQSGVLGAPVPASSGLIPNELASLLSIYDALFTLGELWTERGSPRVAKYYFQRGLNLAKERKSIGVMNRFTHALAHLASLRGKDEDEVEEMSNIRRRFDKEDDEEQVATNRYQDVVEQHMEVCQKSEVALLRGDKYIRSSPFQETFKELCDRFPHMELNYERDRTSTLKSLASKGDDSVNFDLAIMQLSESALPLDSSRARFVLAAKRKGYSVPDDIVRIVAEECTSDLITQRDLYGVMASDALDLEVISSDPVVSYLAHAAIGLSLRAERARHIKHSEDADLFQWHRLQSITDSAKVQAAAISSRLNKAWVIVSVSMVTSERQKRQLVISRASNDGVSCLTIKVTIPSDAQDLLEDFCDIMKQNETSTTMATPQYTSAASRNSKKRWWDERYELENRLEEWLNSFQCDWLAWGAVFCLGLRGSDVDVVSLHERCKNEFSSDRERAAAFVCLNALGRLDQSVIVDALLNTCPMRFGKDNRDSAKKFLDGGSVTSLIKGSRSKAKSITMIECEPALLVLSSAVQHLPWECLPMFDGHPVSRIPSLPFALESFPWMEESSERTGAYVVDPQCNLPETFETLRNTLCELEATGKWQGVARKAPDDLKAYLSENSVVLYCGHGGGEEFINSDELAQLKRCAVTFLIGCSSGKRKDNGVFEPHGIVNSYSLASAPLVVANLWNVTDKDIDRFTLSLLDELKLQGKPCDVLRVVAASRKVCKLKRLVGAAPVCYGVPVVI